MKKQFFRVKQLADQTFSRSGKTEVLSDDLQNIEKRVEFIRTICTNAGKKLANPAAGSDNASRDKRLKKNPEYCLGQSMMISASAEDDQLLKQVVTECGKMEFCLGNAFVEHEIQVESNVVSTLLNICETEYPNVMKQKRNLSKLILDMDSARTRYQTATKHSGSSTGSKVDSIKDELEEAEQKVEQCRDTLVCEMLQLITKEVELSTTILEYAKLKRNYHTAAIDILDKCIPDMEAAINESFCRPIFGYHLEDHLRITGRKIAYPLELCVCCILELGIAEEGLFRVAAGASKVRRVKLSIDANCMDLNSALEFRDPHIFAGVLKSYLRSLPEPLLTHELYEQWISAAKLISNGNTKEGLSALWTVLHNLPKANYDNLQYLIKFFSTLSSNKQNKMTPQNIAIVIAPNLMWGPNEDINNIEMNMNTANLHNIVVDTLISYSSWFFSDNLDFYITFSKGVNVLNGHEDAVDSMSVSTTTVTNSSQSDEKPLKRSQSSSSLSDHNSPPHGSPKPAIRSRKQKPHAPNPPTHRQSFMAVEDKTSNNLTVKNERLSEIEHTKPKIDDSTINVGEEYTVMSSPTKIITRDNITSTENQLLKEQLIFSKSKLDKRHSKSGEDLRKITGTSKAQDIIYGTLERKKPPRPVPAPRTSLELSVSSAGDMKKPTIPQRPANLPRPHSSSFRINRTSEFDSPTNENPASLEKTHIYSVDKQQISIIQVNSDTAKSSENKPNLIIRERLESFGDKPEKPKKPETLNKHQRAASEGSIIDAGTTERFRMPPHCSPPPPPQQSSISQQKRCESN